jgi:serine/threonine protein kinase
MAILSGKRLGPYEILSAIGAGGMGEVYRARDTRLDRTVAIKDGAFRAHASRTDFEVNVVSPLRTDVILGKGLAPCAAAGKTLY